MIFCGFNLNRWTNQATAWLPLDWWNAVRGADALDFRRSPRYEATAGLDMAQ